MVYHLESTVAKPVSTINKFWYTKLKNIQTRLDRSKRYWFAGMRLDLME